MNPLQRETPPSGLQSRRLLGTARSTFTVFALFLVEHPGKVIDDRF
jgi:hypothetical protein